MKNTTILLTIVLISLLCYFSCGFVYADSTEDTANTQPTWVRITSKDTWLYKTASLTENDKLFLLQYSYYAKVKETTQNGFYHVEILDNVAGFVKILGYVPVDKVTPQTEAPLSPTYPTVFSTVKQNNIILFSQPNATSDAVCAVYQGQTLSFFGTYPTSDKTWYFVRFEQNLCYVDANGVTLPAIALHPTPVYVPTVTPEQDENPSSDNQSQEQEQEQQPTPQEDFSKWQIIIVALIAISAVVIVIVLFLPAKSKEQKTPTYINDGANPQDVTLNSTEQRLSPHYFDDYL